LSFLATIGLVYLTPKVEERMKRLSNRLGLRTVVASTVATNIFVLPFIVYQMGIFSIVALPVNVLILPTIPFAMLFGVFTVAFGAISTAVALPISFATHAVLAYVLGMIKTFASFSFASVAVSHVPFAAVLVSYALLCYIMFRKKSI
jgi:competence protein ComEC